MTSAIPRVHPAATYSQLAGGAFACITFMVPAMLFLVVAFRPERDPDITLALNDMAWIFLVIAWPPFAVQNWSLVFFKTGPFAWNGLIVFWVPATVFTTQFIGNTVGLLRAVKDEQATILVGAVTQTAAAAAS